MVAMNDTKNSYNALQWALHTKMASEAIEGQPVRRFHLPVTGIKSLLLVLSTVSIFFC